MLNRITILFDDWIVYWLLFCMLGNLVIAELMFTLHKFKGTGRTKHFCLKYSGNLLELMVYSILIYFQIFTLLAGLLAIKAVGNIGMASADDTKNGSDERSVKIVAIYRLGFILQLIVAAGAAYILSKSEVISTIETSSWFMSLY